MQKDLQNATEALSKELNNMYENDKSANLLKLVDKQVDEIDRRGKIIMKMEDSIKLQQQNIKLLQEQNKQLEMMVEDLRRDRQKLLEEISSLKSKKVTRPRTKKTVTKKKEGDAPNIT